VYFLSLLFAFIVSGERLEYDIKYGPVLIGSMVLEHLAPESLAGERFEHFRAEVEIDQYLSWFFWARYRFESWCRSKDLLTVRSYKKTTEKNYRAEIEGIFDHSCAVVKYSDKTIVPLSDSARDMLSLWYYLRMVDWNKRESLAVNAHIDRRNWQLKLRLTGKQKVKTAAGEFWCLVIKPDANGPLGTILVSDEPHRLPVLIRSRVGGLTIAAILRNIIIYE